MAANEFEIANDAEAADGAGDYVPSERGTYLATEASQRGGRSVSGGTEFRVYAKRARRNIILTLVVGALVAGFVRESCGNCPSVPA